MPEAEQKTPLVIQRLERDQFFNSIVTEMGGKLNYGHHKAERFIQRFKQHLMSDKDLCEKASLNLAAARHFLKRISVYAPVDAAPVQDLVISAYEKDRAPGGVDYQIQETLKFQMRLIATVPNLFIGQPQVVIKGVDKFKCYVDTSKSHDLIVDYVPDLESDVHPSPENIQAAFVNYRHNGAWGTVVVPKRDILNAKAHSKGSGNPKSPWQKHFGAMAKNTAIKRLLKILPIPQDTDLFKHLERTSEIEADSWDNVDQEGEIHQPRQEPAEPPVAAGKRGRPRKEDAEPPRKPVSEEDFDDGDGGSDPAEPPKPEPKPKEKPKQKQEAEEDDDDGGF